MANARYSDKNEKMPRLIYFKSIFRSLIFTVIIFLILAAVITYTSVSESIMPLMTSIIMVLSIAFSGLLSAIRIQRNGFVHGMITGAIYIIFVILLSWFFINNFSIDKYTILKGVVGIAAGGIGGMIGVNLK